MSTLVSLINAKTETSKYLEITIIDFKHSSKLHFIFKLPILYTALRS